MQLSNKVVSSASSLVTITIWLYPKELLEETVINIRLMASVEIGTMEDPAKPEHHQTYLLPKKNSKKSFS